MDIEHRKSLVDLSVQKGLEALEADYPMLKEQLNASLAENPVLTLRMLFMGHIISRSFISRLRACGKQEVAQAVERLRADFDTGAENPWGDFTVTLSGLPDLKRNVPALILTAAALSLFFGKDGTVLANVYLDMLFDGDYARVLFTFGDEMRFTCFLFCALWMCDVPGTREAVAKHLQAVKCLTAEEKAALERAA